MKITQITTLLLGAFFLILFTGCASSNSESSSSDTAPSMGSENMDSMDTMKPESTGTKTAYDGSTGPSLLMERYKSGQIEGFRN